MPPASPVVFDVQLLYIPGRLLFYLARFCWSQCQKHCSDMRKLVNVLHAVLCAQIVYMWCTKQGWRQMRRNRGYIEGDGCSTLNEGSNLGNFDVME